MSRLKTIEAKVIPEVYTWTCPFCDQLMEDEDPSSWRYTVGRGDKKICRNKNKYYYVKIS